MSDQSAVENTDLLVRLVLEAVEQRLKDVRDEVARLAIQSEQQRRDMARLAGELGRWLTAKSKAEDAMSARIDALFNAVDRLNNGARTS